MPRDWPAPYLQPERHTGCDEHSIAYVCRCLRHPDMTAEDVFTFRSDTNHWEYCFPFERLGIESVLVHGQYYDRAWVRHEAGIRKLFHMGAAARPWVESYLAAGWLGVAHVWRVERMMHAVAVLECRGDDGVFIMDPVHGHKVEPWSWFLGRPEENWGHQLTGWYR